MPTLVIESFPEKLYEKLQKLASSHQQSMNQETIDLIEKAIADKPIDSDSQTQDTSSWANRKILPEYAALLESQAFQNGIDSTISLSDERDAR